MTVWTMNVMLKHHASGVMCCRLWGDDDAQLFEVLYGIGASIDDKQQGSSWENYLITPEQQMLAVSFYGVPVMDYLEPRYQRAVREGDAGMVDQINRTRAHVGTVRVPLLMDPLAKGVLH